MITSFLVLFATTYQWMAQPFWVKDVGEVSNGQVAVLKVDTDAWSAWSVDPGHQCGRCSTEEQSGSVQWIRWSRS